MPDKVWLIPEGSTPHDEEWPWKRELDIEVEANPFAALRLAQQRGIDIESYWYIDDLWISGYDMADALRETLVTLGAEDVRFEVCWEQCEVTWGKKTWRGPLYEVLELALGLEPRAGAARLFAELRPKE